MLQHVSDNLGVVEALAGRGSPAIIIGHDWGVTHAWPRGLIAARLEKLARTIRPSPAPQTRLTGARSIPVVRRVR